MKYKKCSSLFLLLFAITSGPVYAVAGFKVDTLFKVGNKNGHGLFTVTNPSKVELFLTAKIVKVEVVDGEIKKTALTRENFPLWDLAINPTRVRMMPGEVKDFSVKYLCQKNCPREEDLIYQIKFSPATVSKSEGQSVEILFGVAPYYIIPALNNNIDFEIDFDHESNVLTAKNIGNTYIKIDIDNCKNVGKENTGSCRGLYTLLPGRENTFKIPSSLIGNSTETRVYNHDQSYEKKLSL